METVKWHMLDHVVDEKVRIVCPYFCDAGIYYYPHFIFKQIYETTSEQINSTMDASTAVLGRRLCKYERKTTRKRPKHNVLEQAAQDMLCIPRLNV